MSARHRAVLAGRVALVTGASGGIGQAIVERLRADGAWVAACDLEAAPTETTDGASFACDVTEEMAIADVFARVERVRGPVDTLVNNAGTSVTASLAETALSDWRRVVDVNLTATFLTTRALLHSAAVGGNRGVIVNVASVGARRPEALIGAYCAAKAGALQLTRVAALEGAPDVRANCICPGVVDTPMLRSSLAQAAARCEHSPEDALVERLSGTPLGRLQSAESIAVLTSFLASDAARDITGATFDVNGGEFMG